MEKGRQSFLNTVRDQITSKEAKDFVAVELDHHIKEAKNKWMEKGIDETEAEEKAVGQMGSPITLGQQLNKLHRPKVDWLTVMLLVTTMGLGFLPILFIGADYYSTYGVDASYFTMRKAVLVLLGGAVALGIMLIDYRKLEKYGSLFYGIGILVLVLLQAFADSYHNGALINIGPFTIEGLMAIPFFLFAWASFFNRKELKLRQLSLYFILSLYLLLEITVIPIAYMYAVMVLIMLWWSRFSLKLKRMITGGIVGSLLLIGFTALSSSRISLKSRLLEFINPEQYAGGAGYLLLLVQERMSKAGWFGNALNGDRIPDVHTDLVFVGFTYYFGWLAAFTLVCLLALFIVRIMMITRNIHEPFGKLLLVGAVALYTVQLVSNIGMTLGLFPMNSISLPFISYGLMPVLLNAFLIGIVLSVYRRKDLTAHRSIQPQ